jgi:segregation and condensation protein B
LKENEQKSSDKSKKDKFTKQIALMEAGLYVAGRPLDLKTLAGIIGTRSKKKVKKIANNLIEDYNNRQTALEILELEDNRFVMQLKADYTNKVKKLATRPLLSAGPLKTLSYIAFRQPILQTKVIDVRGHHSYGHLKELEEMDLITREGNGKKRMLKTTTFFADFFGLSHELKTMKRQLKTVFQDYIKPEMEAKINSE